METDKTDRNTQEGENDWKNTAKEEANSDSLVLGRWRTVGLSELFHWKQLPAAAGNEVYESDESEPQQ